jgi:hypothetical protein
LKSETRTLVDYRISPRVAPESGLGSAQTRM